MAISQDTLDALSAYLANPSGQGFSTNLQGFLQNPELGASQGGGQAAGADQSYFTGLYGDQFTKDLLNTPSNGSTNPTIYLGGGTDANHTSSTPISSGNPFYSYFQNLTTQNPTLQNSNGSLRVNAGSGTTAGVGANGQLDIPSDILNQAQAWEQTNGVLGGPNGMSQADYKQQLLDASTSHQTNMLAAVPGSQRDLPFLPSAIKTIFPILASAISPIAGAGASALMSGTQNGNLGSALSSGALSAAGSYGGQALSGAAGATAGSSLDTGIQAGTGAAAGAGQASINGTNPYVGAAGGAAGGAINAQGGLSGILGYGNADNAAGAGGGPTTSGPDSGAYAGNVSPSGSVHLDGYSPTGASPSFFDNLSNGDVSGAASNVGNFITSNPLTTIGGVGLAAKGLMGASNAQSSAPNVSDIALAAPFTPKRQDAMQLPSSLSDFSGLSPDQQESNIATKGVYGGGEGPQENQYFLNLINRQLVDDTGKVGDMGSISPINNSYLSQLGLGGYGNSNDLLKGISQYGT